MGLSRGFVGSTTLTPRGVYVRGSKPETGVAAVADPTLFLCAALGYQHATNADVWQHGMTDAALASAFCIEWTEPPL